MIRVVLALAVLLQPGQRPPLSPAETLLEPVILRAINEQPSGGVAAAVIDGTDETAGRCRSCIC
jgi:hypothetical protein